MRFYLIRHAESTNNASWGRPDVEHVRTADPDISAVGHQQAELLAQHLASAGSEPRQTAYKDKATPDYQLSHLYCSLMNRSLLTAEYIYRSCGIQPVALPDIFERKGLFDYDASGNAVGIEGPGRSYFENRFPAIQLPQDLTEKGWWNRPVESDDHFVERVQISIDSVLRIHRNTDHNVAMVVHGDYLDQSINYLMGAQRHSKNYRSPWVANWVTHNSSVSRIDINQDATNVIYLNRIDHLPHECITW